MIEDWLTLESVQDVQLLLGFLNFHWGFIRKYAKVAPPISNWLTTHGSLKWECAWDAELTF
jgi:hypothetical protein